MEISRKGAIYDFTSETILLYRRGNISAMTNLDQLHQGYKKLIGYVSKFAEINEQQIDRLAGRIKKIMSKSYLKNFEVLKAFNTFLH